MTAIAHAQTPEMDRAEAYLNNITTLTADFQQIAPDGSMAEGKLFLKRPGKMRWDYAHPNPILMVSDGDTLVYYDEEMDEVSYLDLDETLAAFIVKPTINFNDPKLEISQLSAPGGLLSVKVRNAEARDDGAITLIFMQEPIRLYQLVIENAANDATIITLKNVRREMSLSENLFQFRRPMLQTK